MKVHLHSRQGLFTVHDYNLTERTVTIQKDRKDVVVHWKDVRAIRDVSPGFGDITLDTKLNQYLQWWDTVLESVYDSYQVVYNEMGQEYVIPTKK